MERRPATTEEARALSNPLRLRILRLCLDRALTNKELAERLGRDPGTVLHHVRVLVASGFLAPEPDRRGTRGAVERPYRATGKSWTLDVGDRPPAMLAMVDAFRGELAESSEGDVRMLSRFMTRLTPDAFERFDRRLEELVADLVDADDPAGDAYSVFVGVHRRREGEALRPVELDLSGVAAKHRARGPEPDAGEA